MTTRAYQSKGEMDAKMIATLTQMMESQAYRELAAAQMFGYGLQFVPELRWLKFMSWHIREEMEHYEVVVRMYKEFTGESVEPLVNSRLAKKPIDFAQSWFELAMAQFLYDRGGFWQLREYEECAYVPYRDIIQKILKEEAGHQGLGERIVVELCRSGALRRREAALLREVAQAGDALVRAPRHDGQRYAIDVGPEEARLGRGDAGLRRRHQAGGEGVRPRVPGAAGDRPRVPGHALVVARRRRRVEGRGLRRARLIALEPRLAGGRVRRQGGDEAHRELLGGLALPGLRVGG